MQLTNLYSNRFQKLQDDSLKRKEVLESRIRVCNELISASNVALSEALDSATLKRETIQDVRNKLQLGLKRKKESKEELKVLKNKILEKRK